MKKEDIEILKNYFSTDNYEQIMLNQLISEREKLIESNKELSNFICDLYCRNFCENNCSHNEMIKKALIILKQCEE